MTFAAIVVFLFGLGVGSFLNAVIYRLGVGDSAFRGRSYCPRCKQSLAWYDLIPVLSFVLLGGKCRYCGERISWQYPIVEILTALLFLVSFKSQVSILNQATGIETLNILYLWTIASLLIILFAYDLKYYILPDKILFPAIGVVVAYRALEAFGLGVAWSLSFVIWGFAAAAFFFAIFALSRGAAMGFGDVKLAFFMGLFLGWPNVAVALFVAFLTGAAIGLALLLLKKKGMKSEIPFGPFLIAGTFAALFWGKALVDFYFDLMVV